MPANWERNNCTGDYILRLTQNTRIMRMAGGGLYRAEYWGNFSLDFPKNGPWRKTLAQAKRDLTDMSPTR